MSVIPGSDLEFREYPGRSTADPLRSVQQGEVTVRVVIIEGVETRTPHRHPHSPEVVYVAEGRGVAWQEGTATRVGPGDVVWIPQGAAHATLPEPGSRLRLVCFFPHPDLGANLVELDETIDGKEWF